MNSGCSKPLQLIITVLCELPIILESNGDGGEKNRAKKRGNQSLNVCQNVEEEERK
jgi:hypothetical protein